MKFQFPVYRNPDQNSTSDHEEETKTVEMEQEDDNKTKTVETEQEDDNTMPPPQLVHNVYNDNTVTVATETGSTVVAEVVTQPSQEKLEQ